MKQKNKILLILILVLLIGFLGSFTYTYKSLFIESDNQDYIATIMIDAGHGGYDPGSIAADDTMEKDITLSLALQTGKMIQTLDSRIKVIYTRTNDEVQWPSDESQDLAYRVNLSASQGADYYLSIHCNSTENTDATGYSFYIRNGDTQSLRIAHSISDHLKDLHYSSNEGIQYTDKKSLYVVDNQQIPVILFEAGYLSNTKECRKLKGFITQKCIAYSLAKSYVDAIQKTVTDNQ